jgi:hypothetical protein
VGVGLVVAATSRAGVVGEVMGMVGAAGGGLEEAMVEDFQLDVSGCGDWMDAFITAS